jgi:hypothetical protein
LNKPHFVPTAWIIPVNKDVKQNGTITYHALSSMAISEERDKRMSWLVKPVMARTINTATAPSQPIEKVI